MTNIMDDVGASVSGDVFDTWAGPVRVALSGGSPLEQVRCQQQRLTHRQGGLHGACATALPTWRLWAQNTVASVAASNNVWEFAAEANIPLLKDLPLVQSFDANVAGRYNTDYSTSGTVQTWKVGLDYHVNDDVRFPRHEFGRYSCPDAERPVLADTEFGHRLHRHSHQHQCESLHLQQGQSRPAAGSGAHLYRRTVLTPKLHSEPDAVL